MTINSSEVFFKHDGKHWTAVLRWDNKGGLIENPGRDNQWIHLFNANADDVIKLLNELGVPTDNIPVPKKEHSQQKLQKAVFTKEVVATVEHYNENGLKEKFTRTYYQGDSEKFEKELTLADGKKQFRVEFADSQTDYEYVTVPEDAVELT